MSTIEKIHRILTKRLKEKVRKNSKTEKDNFQKTAQMLMNSMKKQEQKSGEVDSFWKAIEAEAFTPVQKKPARKLFLLTGAVAASLLIIITISIWKPDSDSRLYAIIENNISKSDNENIILINGNLRKQIRNNTEIQYLPNGVSVIPQSQIISSSNITDATFGQDINHLIIPAGKRVKVVLSDGTRLYINANTQVAYPSVFNRNKREIAVNGEAYLEVAHNPNYPFIVKANGFNVKVLGTKFNISAYKNEKAKVLLVQGSVALQDINHRELCLKPYELADINKMSAQKVDRVENYICWKDGLIMLDNEPISMALMRISKYYGIQINGDSQIVREKISGKLKLTDNVENVIKNITNLVGAKYYREDNCIKITKY